MSGNLIRLLSGTRVIPAVRRWEDAQCAANSASRVVFMLCGDINNVSKRVSELTDSGKAVFVHFEMIGGLGQDRAALAFLARSSPLAGIISTRNQAIRAALDMGLMAIQRVFMVDSQGLETGVAMIRSSRPSGLELLPGLLPSWVVSRVKDEFGIPIISGGLLRLKEDTRAALATGVDAVSLSNPSLW